jgi:hypothetical protein
MQRIRGWVLDEREDDGVPHFCECSAGCEMTTPYWERYCERHSGQPQAVVGELLDEGCPRCGLPPPEGLQLHRCSKLGRRRVLNSRLRIKNQDKVRDDLVLQ